MRSAWKCWFELNATLGRLSAVRLPPLPVSDREREPDCSGFV